MDAPADVPSTRYAIATFAALLGIPLIVFAIGTFSTIKANVDDSTFVLMSVVYALGTLPGLVLGTRYLRTTGEKATFAVGYVLVCLALLFLASFGIGCWITNVCL